MCLWGQRNPMEKRRCQHGRKQDGEANLQKPFRHMASMCIKTGVLWRDIYR